MHALKRQSTELYLAFGPISEVGYRVVDLHTYLPPSHDGVCMLTRD